VRKPGVFAAEIEFCVAFHDIDMVGVVWHGHYLKYFENARWALMERLGYGLQRMVDSGYAWPVVDLQVKYLHAARFDDSLRARAALVEWENRLVINYLVTRTSDSVRIVRAQTVQVAVAGHSGELQFVCPDDFVATVRKAIAA
jgi:acyl-CoA thioester hydrolase